MNNIYQNTTNNISPTEAKIWKIPLLYKIKKKIQHQILKWIFKSILAQSQTLSIFLHGIRFTIYTQIIYFLKLPVN